MQDHFGMTEPAALGGLVRATRAAGFDMASGPRTGALLKALAASKPGSAILELGTGTGIGTTWLLAGMDADARLQSVDVDPNVSRIASDALGHDPRVTFVVEDGIDFISRAKASSFGLIFADAMPGKFEALNETLDLVAPGGIYIIDDLLPQENWPHGHDDLISPLLAAIESREDFATVRLAWSTGIMIATRMVMPHG